MADPQTVSRTLTLDSREEAVILFGPRDAYLRLVRDALAVRVVARGDTLQVDGIEEAVNQAERVFAQLRAILRKNGKLTTDEVKAVLEVVQGGDVRGGPTTLTKTEGGKFLRPRTDGQGRYVQALKSHDLVMCVGPAGTGKTYLAVGWAVTLLKSGAVRKIVLVRPAVEAGERLGFLPGDLVAKINPYLRPLFDALNDIMEPQQVKLYMESDVIEILPLAYMRGRTLNHACIILDEGQNATVAQMKMFLTRMGQGTRSAITGDVTQIDLANPESSGLVKVQDILNGVPDIKFIYFEKADVVRHRLVRDILQAFDEFHRTQTNPDDGSAEPHAEA